MRALAFVVVVGCYGHGQTPPGGLEVCGDGLDNNGNDLIDEGCGGLAEVGDLTTASQIDLCRDFVVQICENSTDPAIDGFCADACITDPQSCVDASETLGIDTECDLVLVEDVEECFITGDLDFCAASGGGCVFDALEAVCPV